MKKILNKKINTGITLIALVITIVVLIILAAVAINLSLGNNGIFNRAKTGKELYQNAQDYEQTEVAKSTNQINSYINGNRDYNASLNYSLDEKVIGTWVDGKPLYQKTFIKENVTINANTTTHIEMGTGAQNCKLVTAFGARDDCESIPYSWPSFNMIGCITTDNKFIIEAYRSGSAFTISKITMTYQYTKTTD